MPDGDSFLPRIQSVFYAVFDETIGPTIVYQVPEGLIASPSVGQPSNTNGNGSIPSSPSPETSSPAPQCQNSGSNGLTSRNSSTSLVSPTDYFRRGRKFPSPQKRSISSQRTLFNFSNISMYVIPPSQLCGRLVTCSTSRHRIMGFPVELTGKYKRNYFRYNLCFVFDRGADLSCYESVVRKVSRVLKSCEEESGFLSSVQTSPLVHAILEQLYEDLNSYSETSIAIDQFNSIELKIFPFYPNPPEVKDWMVPLALINLSKRFEENWDLTMLKVCRYVDGINHVSRIAQLADCDILLTRQAISHLLYYQVIMTIDIFQYSNMYTLCKSIQWLADQPHVKDECGPYVTRPGMGEIADWPELLHLYSRLKPGKTIAEWMEAYGVETFGIDVRRFTTFGVIKGFLRRVHRWPVYIRPEPSQLISDSINYPIMNPFDPANSNLARKRAKSLTTAALRFPAFNPALSSDMSSIDPALRYGPTPQSSTLFPSLSPEHGLTMNDPPPTSNVTVAMSATQRARRASAAEKVLEQLRSRDAQKSGANGVLPSPRASWIYFQKDELFPSSGNSTATGTGINPNSTTATAGSGGTHANAPASHESPTKNASSRELRRSSLISPSVPPPSPVISKVALAPSRPRPTRSPSTPYLQVLQPSQQTIYPMELVGLLDGDHHTDEIGVRLSVGWPLLESWLIAVGDGQGDGDFGNVVIIYR